ncbi:hypothetical protein KVG88_30055 [Pseudomonas sp. SWRI74]|jgi:hypothetical protein|uniref:Uncharacterized protein n=1 Tax=Pseudomonas azerbaijanoccidentalis TaxID=2842347 RepID=A0ABS6QZK8_9PSED|nr:hypothetical protein [Pseudomonas azerbaijanoccidentalis]MBV4524319.1 hypothetical protein [Pseudomonas azerbaijanoccidentalis]
MNAFLRWMGRFVEEGTTGRPSVKRFGFALCVTVLSAVIGLFGGVMGGVAWMAHGSAQAIELVRIIASSLEVISGMVLASVTTGYVAGKAVERPRKELQSPDEAAKP